MSGDSRPCALQRIDGASVGKDAAILFVHGFSGSGDHQGTWKDLAGRVMTDDRLRGWDGWAMTYGSNPWMPDVYGIWSADADLEILARRLAADLTHAALKPYKALVLIAHSMGGLIVQRMLCDEPDIARRVSDVLLFGTPSAGLKKATMAWFWMSQLADMAHDSAFVGGLRSDWTSRFGAGSPFDFLAVAGEQDQFVPPMSSIHPFPRKQTAVVAGNHVSMLHPASDDPQLQELIVNWIIGSELASEIVDSAELAIERGEFHRVIGQFLPNAETLDDDARVELAIALDSVGKRDEASRVLSMDGEPSTDVIGTIAGRLKRNWIETRDRNQAEAAGVHYEKGFERAKAEGDLSQVRYHGINLAFLLYVFRGDSNEAKRFAREVLDICSECREKNEIDPWIDPTEAEAHFILGNIDEAIAGYRRFVDAGHKPWQMASALQDALIIAHTLEIPGLDEKLRETFTASQAC
ncbi:MAG: alpha/beta hydrolase [Alphaproteobacteria bacterium]|nr:alpha/beta hydrolase [Alphaproteobacteria bacterium]